MTQPGKNGANSLRGTLDGIRVADFSNNLAGPYAAMLLGDLGADVIKVERPQGGDDSRAQPPFWNGESVVYLTVNRNKRSIALDFKDETDVANARRLAETADVVVQSFRPGVMDRLGLGYDAIKERNRRVVYVSISAFGEEGPGRDLPGYDPLVQAFTGLMNMTGEADGPPVRVAASITDLSAGLFSVIATLAALRVRERTGEGTRIDVSLSDSLLAMMNHQVTTVIATGKAPGRLGSASPIAAPYQAIRAQDGHIMVAAGNQSLWTRLAGAIGAPGLVDDPRFENVAKRVANLPALVQELEARTLKETVAHWVKQIGAAGVPCGPVNDLADTLKDPIVTERDVIAAVPGHPNVPDLALVDLPFRAGGKTLGGHRPAPTLGQHSAEILDELAATANKERQQ
ncbi:MAG: CoA transferase [Chloroflexi bacterium]|nr:MAG: CoA transferase [Chloroflexota bacterium]